MRTALACCLVAACAGDPSEKLAVGHVEPPYGPLGGGTTVQIDGAQFTPQTRVLIGGREAPYVHAVTPERLEIAAADGAASFTLALPANAMALVRIEWEAA